MPPRRRRAEAPPRRWPYLLLVVAGVLMGAVLWAYTPDLPAETLSSRYAGEGSRAHTETYTVEVPVTATLLDCLDEIKDKQDGKSAPMEALTPIEYPEEEMNSKVANEVRGW